jgi:hypothetical protein
MSLELSFVVTESLTPPPPLRDRDVHVPDVMICNNNPRKKECRLMLLNYLLFRLRIP